MCVYVVLNVNENVDNYEHIQVNINDSSFPRAIPLSLCTKKKSIYIFLGQKVFTD